MDSNTENTQEVRIELYLSGAMSSDEREQFEKQMATDEDLHEAVTLQRSLGQVLLGNDWTGIDSNENREVIGRVSKTLQQEDYTRNRENIQSAAQAYASIKLKQRRRRSLTYLTAAATVSVLIISVFLFEGNPSTQTIYEQYADWNDLTSYIEQGSSLSAFTRAELSYHNQNYQEAISILKETIKRPDDPMYTPSLIYLGAAYVGIHSYSNAIETFDVLIKSDAYDSSKGYWYQLLIYLKTENTSKINDTVDSILSDESNYNYDKVLEIQAMIK